MNKLLSLLFCMLLFISCEKDDFSNTLQQNNLTDDELFLEQFGSFISADFIGEIITEDGRKVKDAQVTIGTHSTTTDHNGIFIINNASVRERFAYVTVIKEGYINGSRTLVPVANGTNDVQITLLEKHTIATVSSGAPSEVVLPNGSKVSFTGDFIDDAGNTYTGAVEVNMNYLAPNTPDTFTTMPGSLIAQNSANQLRSLETYGMLGVNLFSPSGAALNIAPSSLAQLEFPIATSTPNAPETIALWSFDEEKGYWKEDGTAVKAGNKYIAEVSHFSWWTPSTGTSTVNACFVVKNNDVLANHYVSITKSDNLSQVIFSGYTNDQGAECGLFPINETLRVRIFDSCLNNVIYDQELNNINEGDHIEINVASNQNIEEVKITGYAIGCSGLPLNDGYAYIYNDTSNSQFNQYIPVSINHGVIDYNLVVCPGTNYKMIVFDLNTQRSTGVFDLDTSNSTIDLQTVFVCSNQVGGVYEGELTLTTQGEVDLFGLLGYTKVINGWLTFSGDEIYNLDRITSLKEVEDLNFSGTSLISLSKFFTKLNRIGALGVNSNSSLVEISNVQIEHLQNNLNVISIIGNNNLNSLKGLEWIQNISSHLNISSNEMLQDLSGLENLVSIGADVTISGNDSLITLNGLNDLEQVFGKIQISNNSVLRSLEGIDNLSFSSNWDVGILSDFSVPVPNPNLSDFCALQNLFTNGTYGTVNIQNNAYNPTVQDIIDGNCSQ